MNKPEELKKEIKVFTESDKTTDDLMKLFYVVTALTRQGSGLTWGEVEKITNEVLECQEI